MRGGGGGQGKLTQFAFRLRDTSFSWVGGWVGFVGWGVALSFGYERIFSLTIFKLNMMYGC